MATNALGRVFLPPDQTAMREKKEVNAAILLLSSPLLVLLSTPPLFFELRPCCLAGRDSAGER